MGELNNLHCTVFVEFTYRVSTDGGYQMRSTTLEESTELKYLASSFEYIVNNLYETLIDLLDDSIDNVSYKIADIRGYIG